MTAIIEENRREQPAIPSFDEAPASSWTPRAVTAPAPARGPGAMRRRAFLRTLGAGGMTLGLTVLGWLPSARQRQASATVGTEYLHCAGYENDGGYVTNTILCYGFPYSSMYCGADGWFKNGWFRDPGDNSLDLYVPRTICGDGYPARNGWRWTHTNGVTYRCTDGYIYWNGTGTPYAVICSKAL